MKPLPGKEELAEREERRVAMVRLREGLGLSQPEFAEALGISWRSVGKMECGDRHWAEGWPRRAAGLVREWLERRLAGQQDVLAGWEAERLSGKREEAA